MGTRQDRLVRIVLQFNQGYNNGEQASMKKGRPQTCIVFLEEYS